MSVPREHLIWHRVRGRGPNRDSRARVLLCTRLGLRAMPDPLHSVATSLGEEWGMGESGVFPMRSPLRDPCWFQDWPFGPFRYVRTQ